MRKVLIILGILIGLVLIIFVVGIFSGFSRPGSEISKTAPLPRNYPSYVKGVFLPSATAPFGHSISDPARLKEDGINLVAFPIEYRVNQKGKQSKFSSLRDFMASQGKGMEKAAISTIRKYKEAGLAVFLTTQLRYLPKGEGGEPQGIPESLQNDPEFFRRFNEFVLDWAEIAEKENVEYFAPTNEPEYMMGVDKPVTWAQEILPQVRQRFSGKIVFKSGLVLPGQISWANFKGYDIAGTTIAVLDEYRKEQYQEMVKALVPELVEVAKERDKVPEVWISCFGVNETIRNLSSLSEEQKAEVYQIVFEEAHDKVKGLIPWEVPSVPLKDTLMEKVIKKWFKEIK